MTLPPNTTAEVWLPNGSPVIHVGSGRRTFTVTVLEQRPIEKTAAFWSPE